MSQCFRKQFYVSLHQNGFIIQIERGSFSRSRPLCHHAKFIGFLENVFVFFSLFFLFNNSLNIIVSHELTQRVAGYLFTENRKLTWKIYGFCIQKTVLFVKFHLIPSTKSSSAISFIIISERRKKQNDVNNWVKQKWMVVAWWEDGYWEGRWCREREWCIMECTINDLLYAFKLMSYLRMNIWILCMCVHCTASLVVHHDSCTA